MDEHSTLSDLAKKLQQSKERDLKQVQRIEKKKLSELSQQLNEQLKKELSTIEDDMTTKLYGFKENLIKVRSEIVKEEKELMQEIKAQRMEIIEEIEDLNKKLIKIKSRQWIIPIVIGFSIIAGMSIGAYALGKYVTHQVQILQEIDQEIKEEKKLVKFKKIKVFSNGITIQKKPTVFQTKHGDWAVMLKEN